MAKKYTRQDLRDAAEKYKNWGKWGPNDEIGTLNYTSAEVVTGDLASGHFSVPFKSSMFWNGRAGRPNGSRRPDRGSCGAARA